MHPKRIDVPKESSSSVRVRADRLPYFYNPWHYHPELELTYVMQGTGTRFVGDSIEPFGPGDMVLVGSSLPHLWRNDNDYFRPDSGLVAQAVVVHFREDFLGSGFWEAPQLKAIYALLQKAKRGIKVAGPHKAEIARKLEMSTTETPLRQTLLLLEVLDRLAAEEEPLLLSGAGFLHSIDHANASKINQVYKYIFDHFTGKIRLEDVAEVAHMTPNAFCRYFRKTTRKTFSEFLNEIRVGYACKLILEKDMLISQASLESGFQNLSNFNAIFKKVKGHTPSQLLGMKQYLGKYEP